jgi:hypothetical protein
LLVFVAEETAVRPLQPGEEKQAPVGGPCSDPLVYTRCEKRT